MAASIFLPGGGAGDRICQADGCCADLSREPRYCQLRRLCTEHMRADELTCDGAPSRFCHQCGKVEPLSAFDANKRSCRIQLARRRATAGSSRRQLPVHRDSTRHTQHSASSGSLGAAASGSPGGADDDAAPSASLAGAAWPTPDAAAVSQQQHALLLMLQQKQALLQRQLELLRMKQAAEAELMRLQQLHSTPLPTPQQEPVIHGDACINSVTAPLCAPVGFAGTTAAPAAAFASATTLHALSPPRAGSSGTLAPAAPEPELLRLTSIFCDTTTHAGSDDAMTEAAADQLALSLLAQGGPEATSRCNSSSSCTLAWHAQAMAPWAPADGAAMLPTLAGTASISSKEPALRMDVDEEAGSDMVDDEFVDMLEMALLQAGAAALSSSRAAP